MSADRETAASVPAKSTPYTHQVRYGAEELDQLREALENGTLFYASGKKVTAFERAFARYCGVDHAIACSSGTAAIHAALMALGIGPGDEVVTSPITDIGTIIPILFQGAVPVFADLHPHRYTLDPASVEERMTDRTRAVLAVHLSGNVSDLDALQEICRRRRVFLVEDAAQAIGANYRGQSVGTVGDVGCFSLNEYKQISCGDGGVVVTRDPDLAHRLRLATDKCYDRRPEATLRQPFFLANNYRMTELQGAVALAQLGKLKSILDRRRRWCSALSEGLTTLPGIDLPEVTPGAVSSWWFYMLRVRPEEAGMGASELAAALQAQGLPAGAHYIGRCIYEYPLLRSHLAFPGEHAAPGWHPYAERSYDGELCPVAQSILDTAVVLSINEGYTRQDLDESIVGFERVLGPAD